MSEEETPQQISSHQKTMMGDKSLKSLLEDYSEAKNISGLHDQSKSNVKYLTKRVRSAKRVIFKNEQRENMMKMSTLGLKYLLKKNKIQNLVKNFKIKLLRNVTNFTPIQENHILEENQKNNLRYLQWQGFDISKSLEISFIIFEIIHFIFLIIFYGMSFAFYSEMEKEISFQVFKYFTTFFMIIKMAKNSICQKNTKDGKLTYVPEIFNFYFNNFFLIDLLCFLISIISIAVEYEQIKILQSIFLLKGKEFFQNIGEIENFFGDNFQIQQYLGVVKVFIINFLVAHFIGILYIFITDGQETNWMTTMDIIDQPWNQKYAYAYFWAMSTMLGFGNAVPSNPKQAYIISCIECFSVVIFAYIINHVGTLLSNITKRNEQTSQNFQTSRRLASENNITGQLFLKINNYIQQTDQRQKKINFKRDADFLSNLPEKLRKDFFKQSNKETFCHLYFFKDLTERTLMGLAQIINIKIAHPQQVILSSKDPFKFIILKKGQVGCFPYNCNNSSRHQPFNLIKVCKDEKVKLLNLRIFQEFQEMKYVMKSTDLSTLYELDFEESKNVIKNSKYDFEGFCAELDRSKHVIDQFEVIECEHCPTNHPKVKCPRFRYLPVKGVVFLRYLNQCKTQKNSRKKLYRFKKSVLQKPLKNYLRIYKKIQTVIFTQQIKQKLALEKQRYENSKEIKGDCCEGKYFKNSCMSYIDSTSNVNDLVGKYLFEVRDIFEDFMEIQSLNNNTLKFWSLEVDCLYNFKFYFPDFNPSAINHHLGASKIQTGHKKIFNISFF